MTDVAPQEHTTLLEKPQHIERWLSLARMIPAAIVEKLVPQLADTSDRRLEQDGVDLAVLSTDELERAVTQLGLRGTTVFGHTQGRYLDDPHFNPFWERAAALNVPVYLHASDAPELPPSLIERPELVGPTWSWTAETANRALKLVVGGVLKRFPDTRLVLGRLGNTRTLLGL